MADPQNAQRVTSDAELRQERNVKAIERLAQLARGGATALLAVGAVALVGWLWRVVRTQANALTFSGIRFPQSEGFPAPSVTMAQRIDLLVQSLDALVYSMLAVAVGLFLRVAAGYLVAQAGGSLPRVRPRPEPDWPTA